MSGVDRDLRLTGRLLVAAPELQDPNFQRAVVLILSHDEDGAMGLVLNRQLTLEVDGVLPGWGDHVTAPASLFQGGPVGLDGALGLVGVPGDAEEPIGVRRVIGSLGLVDLDTPPEVLSGGLAGLRIFAGHSGWSPGQLEKEIDEQAWHVVEAEPRDAFTDEPGDLWRAVLRRQRGELAFLSTHPADVSMN